MARPEVSGRKPRQKVQVATATKMSSARGPPSVEAACYSVATFCAAHHISQAMYFKMKSEGWGPKEAEVGARVLITFESAAEWRAEREAEAAKTSVRAPSPAA